MHFLIFDRIDPSEPAASELSMACIVRSKAVPNGYSNPQAPQNLFPPRVQIGFWQLGHLVKGGITFFLSRCGLGTVMLFQLIQTEDTL